MAKQFSRITRIAEQMKRDLAVTISRELKDPRLGMVSVQDVRVSRDLSYADVYVTFLTTDEVDEKSPVVLESLKVLNGAAGFLRNEIGRGLRIRVIPHLRFHFDTLGIKSRHLDSLIHRAMGQVRHDREDDAEASD